MDPSFRWGDGWAGYPLSEPYCDRPSVLQLLFAVRRDEWQVLGLSLLYFGLLWLGFGIAGIAFTAVPLAAVWLVLALWLGRRYRALQRQ